ncbi:hypothetical protein [Micromonospora sp. DT233]|uniref:hypothetical protein n=1 Tax=Micromonospora sp. DT233 TaxID=3393432 RepID=UPI003CF809CC
MESSWLCLRGDGTGWTGWANAARGASVSQVTWGCPQEGALELRYTWTASGTGVPGAPPTLVDIDEEGPDDLLVRARFIVSVDTPPLDDAPVTMLAAGTPAARSGRGRAPIQGFAHGPKIRSGQ